MKDALGLVKDGFPFQLTLNKNPERSIPAVDFSAVHKESAMFQQGTKNLRHAHGVFQNKFQKHFQGHKDHTQNRKGGKKMAGRPKYELLATAAELCRVVCNNWLRHITSNSF